MSSRLKVSLSSQITTTGRASPFNATRAIEQLLQGQMKIAEFTDGLATQYGRLFKALSSRLDAPRRIRSLWKRRRSVRVTTRSRRRRLSTEKCP
jgi:hypothetical protein